MRHKKYDDMTPLEQAEYAKKLSKEADWLSNIAMGVSIVTVVLTIIASLDKLVLLWHYVQSCLH